jgi:uncharacterized protein (TIGR03435 family)
VTRTVVAALAVALPIASVAQETKPLAFEVASVRLSAPDARGPSGISPTRVSLRGYPMPRLLEMAFRLHPSQLIAPGWVKDIRVEIQAIPPAGASRTQIPEMLQALLVERFGLLVHSERRSLEAYELVVADGGHKMREVEAADDLATTFPSAPGLPNALDRTLDELQGSVRLMGLPLGMRTITERSMYERIYTQHRTTEIRAIRMTMPELAGILTSNVDALVVDRTGLTGVYQFTLELPPDLSALKMLMGAGITTTIQGTPLSEPSGVSTFKAVEGLGLTLERRKTPLDVIVVDAMRRTPTEN